VFELQQLGRLNLLVGTNNSGKTSILEAVQLLNSPNFESLRDVMIDRGEYVWTAENGNNREIDIKHLFYEHEIHVGSKFSISGSDGSSIEKVVVSIEDNDQLPRVENSGPLALAVNYLKQENITIKVPLSINQGLPANSLRSPGELKNLGVRTQYVTTSSLTTRDMLTLFDQIVLTPEEDIVTESLRTIEPRIERIASVGGGRYVSLSSPGGLVVRLVGSKHRIPLGSMGDGMRRILGLTLAIVNARDGVLLVDEIDTGLHFSAMSDMWKLIWETAKRLNVQVFATTHNSDCWTSLAAIASTESPSEEGITIQRIEKGKPNSIVFTERQVVIAAERGIEVR
jgi:ABC-type cobalamin/Fe3+-siderophores transport system ATPase subunit